MNFRIHVRLKHVVVLPNKIFAKKVAFWLVEFCTGSTEKQFCCAWILWSRSHLHLSFASSR